MQCNHSCTQNSKHAQLALCKNFSSDQKQRGQLFFKHFKFLSHEHSHLSNIHLYYFNTELLIFFVSFVFACDCICAFAHPHSRDKPWPCQYIVTHLSVSAGSGINDSLDTYTQKLVLGEYWMNIWVASILSFKTFIEYFGLLWICYSFSEIKTVMSSALFTCYPRSRSWPISALGLGLINVRVDMLM